jgi:hypothetical protein
MVVAASGCGEGKIVRERERERGRGAGDLGKMGKMSEKPKTKGMPL